MNVDSDSTTPCQANSVINDRMRRWDSIANAISSMIAARRLMSWLLRLMFG